MQALESSSKVITVQIITVYASLMPILYLCSVCLVITVDRVHKYHQMYRLSRARSFVSISSIHTMLPSHTFVSGTK